MSELRTLLKHSSHYLSGRVVLMLLGFVSFPILARVYSVEDYGRISLALKLILLFTVLGKFGLQNSVQRFFAEETQHDSARERGFYTTVLGSVSLIAILITAAFMTAVFLLPSTAITAPLRSALLMAGVLIAIRAIQPAVLGFLRAAGRTGFYNFVDIGTKAVTVGLLVAGFAWISRGVSVFFTATIVAESTALGILIAYLASQHLLAPRSIDYSLAKRILLFGLPLIGYELASVLLDSGDRLLVNHYLGAQAVGHYSAAYNICTYAEESLMIPINLALFPVYMKLWVNRGETATTEFLNRSLQGFLFLAVGVAMFVISCARPVVIVLASRKFENAYLLLPTLVIGLLIYAVHIFFNAPLMIHNRPFTMTKLVVYACVLNIVLNVVLLRVIGLQGAAVATLVSYLFLVIALAIESRKLMQVRMDFRALGIAMLCATATYFVIGLIAAPKPLLTVLARGVVGSLLYGGLLVACFPQIRNAIRNLRAARNISEVAHQPAGVA